MTITQAKELLDSRSISYTQVEYETKADFLKHIVMFPDLNGIEAHRVIALTIHSPNQQMHIHLEFCEKDGIFLFHDLWFGEFSFELFHYLYDEELLVWELIENISDICLGKAAVITVHNLSTRKRLADSIYYLDCDYDRFGRSAFEKALKRIEAKKGFFARLFKTQTQYDIYDWKSHRRIIK